jgi:hypothetical protein
MYIPYKNLTISRVTIKEIGTKFIKMRNHDPKATVPPSQTFSQLSGLSADSFIYPSLHPTKCQYAALIIAPITQAKN